MAGVNVWEHVALILGGVAALTIGAVDALTRQKLGIAIDSALLVAGLGVLGIKGVGGLPG